MPYIAELEKAGIPTVLLDLEDQHNMVEQEARAQGVPNIRFLPASRTLPGPDDVELFTEKMLNALTDPLTEKENESGHWEPPQPRIIFEGTMDEAEDFYQQAERIPHPVNAPIAIYTDGSPIRLPTEERVKKMLTGTSHKPDEIITYQKDRLTMRGQLKKGDPVAFQPMGWNATVEKVATIAVMAGCKPEHLPVALAIAESGCPIESTHSLGQWVCVSGPIVEEIEMSSGCGMLGCGNPSNMAIGRLHALMARNLGGAIMGVNRMPSLSSPFTRGAAAAENTNGLPPGWKGLNEEAGFNKDESAVAVFSVPAGIRGVQHSPGGYRALQKSGHGGMARRLDVKGIPGPHNWLNYVLPELWAGREGPHTIIMIPEMARHLYDIGFKSKDEVYEWLWKQSFMTVEQYKKFSWVDFTTNGWMGIEPISGKHWKELPDDHMVPAGGTDSSGFCIIVGGGDEEVAQEIQGGRGPAGGGPIYGIDAWR
ncbi:MAG: hypothetical protein QF369_01750 [Dehalococcoidales bacterium]|nr:hypothetical protein [Dehalococcoidales bacterium]